MNELVFKYEGNWSILEETDTFLFFLQFVWNFLLSADETLKKPVLGMETTQIFYETSKAKFLRICAWGVVLPPTRIGLTQGGSLINDT